MKECEPFEFLDTYTVNDPSEVCYNGKFRGLIIEAITNRTVAVFEAATVHIGERLCSGCDAPVDFISGACDCGIDWN